MDSNYEVRPEQYDCNDKRCCDSGLPELDAWFMVSGDTDDFIFYGETGRGHSEK